MVEGVVVSSVVEEVSASSQAPSETSGGDMDLDSLDLRDNELDEVASQPLPLSSEPSLKPFALTDMTVRAISNVKQL